MARYVDGFLLAVPRRKLAAYTAMSRKAGKIWKDHGALDYVECAIDDAKPGFGVPFPKIAKSKPGEVVVFSWITYKSRAQRDAINKRVMADARMKDVPPTMPFDVNRMACGGFKTIVEL